MGAWSGRLGLIETIVDRLLLAGAVAAEIILATLVVIVNVEVFLRGLFGISMGIVDELMGYLLVAIVFLGLGQAIRRGALLRVDIFVNAMSVRLARILDRIYALIGVAVLSIYLYQLWLLVAGSYQRGAVSGSTVAIPLWIPQSAMLAGVFLGIIAFMVLTARPATLPSSGVEL